VSLEYYGVREYYYTIACYYDDIVDCISSHISSLSMRTLPSCILYTFPLPKSRKACAFPSNLYLTCFRRYPNSRKICCFHSLCQSSRSSELFRGLVCAFSLLLSLLLMLWLMMQQFAPIFLSMRTRPIFVSCEDLMICFSSFQQKQAVLFPYRLSFTRILILRVVVSSLLHVSRAVFPTEKSCAFLPFSSPIFLEQIMRTFLR
jgi:hypothetical protein